MCIFCNINHVDKIDDVGNFKKSFSLLHLIGLWSRVYYTLLVCDLDFTTS